MTSLTLVPAQETIRYMCFRRFKKGAQTKINMSPQDELQAQIIFPLKPLEIALAVFRGRIHVLRKSNTSSCS